MHKKHIIILLTNLAVWIFKLVIVHEIFPKKIV